MSLSHFDASGQAHMVDVSGKPVTDRTAIAGTSMRLNSASQSDVLRPGRMVAISRYISDMWVRRRSLVASVGRWNTSGRSTASKKRCQRAST